MMLVLGVTKIQALLIAIGIMFIHRVDLHPGGIVGSARHGLFSYPEMGMSFSLAVLRIGPWADERPTSRGIRAVETAAERAGSLLAFVPDLKLTWMPLITFLVYIAVNWWAPGIPEPEPGGGGFIAQRILCAKDESIRSCHPFGFNLTHYALGPGPGSWWRSWPWSSSKGTRRFMADPESGYIRVLMTDLPVSLRD